MEDSQKIPNRQDGVGPSKRSGEGPSAPDPEVSAKSGRRRFSAEYKLRIVQEAEACTQPGELGALLRREGLYSSHLAAWRRDYQEGALGALRKKRGPKPQMDAKSRKRLEQLERENNRLKKELKQAETIIAFQKKFAEMFGSDPEPDNESE